MKKLQVALLGTTLAVALAVSGGSAFAADFGVVTSDPSPAMNGLYVSVFGGVALPTNATGTYDSYGLTVPLSTGFLIGGAIGTHLMNNLRAELELSYSNHAVGSPVTAWNSTYTTNSGSLSTLYALGNLWYDLDMGSNITPYLGGGAGVAVSMPDVSFDGSYRFDRGTVAPAAQLGAGLKVQVTDNMAVDVGYRAKAVFGHTWQEDPNGSASYAANSMSWLDQSVQVGLTVGF